MKLGDTIYVYEQYGRHAKTLDEHLAKWKEYKIIDENRASWIAQHDQYEHSQIKIDKKRRSREATKRSQSHAMKSSGSGKTSNGRRNTLGTSQTECGDLMRTRFARLRNSSAMSRNEKSPRTNPGARKRSRDAWGMWGWKEGSIPAPYG
jgi:hypothetical protein